ncbi:avidin-like [Empidonax traillii]|uniref:avidin-like n=1 Tax=Empidonax traillii TaxID=164674 RepID=UPI000FFD3ACC|nr:avidin-like [Empidonax traillii]
MESSAFALILTLALAAPITSAERKCLLSGSWRSDTGCQMVVSTLGEDGRFSGSYLPGPATGDSEILPVPLHGSQQDAGLVPQPTFSFTVHWRLQDSEAAQTTVFLGQCYVGTNGEEILHVLWLWREATDSPAEDWKATRRGDPVSVRTVIWSFLQGWRRHLHTDKITASGEIQEDQYRKELVVLTGRLCSH